MRSRSLSSFKRKDAQGVAGAGEDSSGDPPDRARAESVHRLQIGLSGIAAMILLVGLANIIQDRARESEERSVPEAAPTTEPSAQPSQTDPLADAGLVPDLPAEPTATPSQEVTESRQKTDDVARPR